LPFPSISGVVTVFFGFLRFMSAVMVNRDGYFLARSFNPKGCPFFPPLPSFFRSERRRRGCRPDYFSFSLHWTSLLIRSSASLIPPTLHRLRPDAGGGKSYQPYPLLFWINWSRFRSFFFKTLLCTMSRRIPGRTRFCMGFSHDPVHLTGNPKGWCNLFYHLPIYLRD